MKKFFLMLIAVVTFTIVACDRDDEEILVNVGGDVVGNDSSYVITDFRDSSEIIGAWRANVSLIDGVEYKLANEILLYFDDNNHFEFTCDNIKTNGTYHYKDSVVYCTKDEKIVITDGLQFKFSNYDRRRVRIDISENVLFAIYQSSILATKD